MLRVALDDNTSSADGFPRTIVLNRRPTTLPSVRQATPLLAADALLLLQFLPSGVCMSFYLKQPVILGRAPVSVVNEVLDLTAFDAMQHGVSRHHCRLERRDQSLTVTDLGTTNGTHLNDQRLVPHQAYQVTPGDRLILGTLHVIVNYS